MNVVIQKVKQFLNGEIKASTLVTSIPNNDPMEEAYKVVVQHAVTKKGDSARVIAVESDHFDVETLAELVKMGFVAKRMVLVQPLG